MKTESSGRLVFPFPLAWRLFAILPRSYATSRSNWLRSFCLLASKQRLAKPCSVRRYAKLQLLVGIAMKTGSVSSQTFSAYDGLLLIAATRNCVDLMHGLPPRFQRVASEISRVRCSVETPSSVCTVRAHYDVDSIPWEYCRKTQTTWVWPYVGQRPN